LKKVEQNQIIKGLIYVEPQVNYQIQESKDYSIEIESLKLLAKIVKYTIIREIIEKI
jgi:hypothetical protein